MPKSVSFDTKEESEYHYENAEEEKEDGNEKAEEGPKLDMVSAEGSSGEYKVLLYSATGPDIYLLLTALCFVLFTSLIYFLFIFLTSLWEYNCLTGVC